MTSIDILQDDHDENYELFVEEAIETGCVWGLEGPEGRALCPSVQTEDVDVLPLWPQPEYAQAHCIEDWSVYKPVPIALEELLDDWLPGMHEDLLLVGTNWNKALEGLELEPLDLLEDIDRVAASLEK